MTERLKELGRVELLLGLGFPFGVALGFLLLVVVLFGLDFLLLFPSRRVSSSIGVCNRSGNQSGRHGEKTQRCRDSLSLISKDSESNT